MLYLLFLFKLFAHLHLLWRVLGRFFSQSLVVAIVLPLCSLAQDANDELSLAERYMDGSDRRQPLKLRVALISGNYIHFKQWAEGHEPVILKELVIQPNDRVTAELTIQFMALKYAGFDVEYEFLVVPNFARTELFLADKRVDLSGESFWTDSPNVDMRHVYMSKPYLRRGELISGLFTSHDNYKVLATQSLEQVKKLKHVLVKYWFVDKRSVRAYSENKLLLANDYTSVTRILEAQRADVTLIEFSKKHGLARINEEVNIRSIPGFYVEMDGERGFLVSRYHPRAGEILSAINKGIDIMRANGDLQSILTAAGYYPPDFSSRVPLTSQNSMNAGIQK